MRAVPHARPVRHRHRGRRRGRRRVGDVVAEAHPAAEPAAEAAAVLDEAELDEGDAEAGARAVLGGVCGVEEVGEDEAGELEEVRDEGRC